MTDQMKNSENKMTGYPSIDKPWLKYYTPEELNQPPAQSTFWRNIYDHNKSYPNDIALIYFGRKITYYQLFSEVDKCALALHAIGIKRGDCVNLLMLGTPEAVYLILACSKIGAIANCMNPFFETEQMVARLNDTGTEWCFVLDRLLPAVEEAVNLSNVRNMVVVNVTNSMPALKRIVASITTKNVEKKCHENNLEKILTWKEFIQNDAGNAVEEVSYQKDTPVLMVYSLGTTGASKGILLSNDGINATIANYQREQFVYQRGDRCHILIGAIWFSTITVLYILMPISLGMPVILELKGTTDEVVNKMMKYHPAMVSQMPSMWKEITFRKDVQKTDLSYIKYPITGGEKLREQDKHRIDSFLRAHGCKSNLIYGYGMCELGSTVTTTDPKYSGKANSSGYPILGVSIAAFDPTTHKELSYRERGEIRVLSPARMLGYFHNEEATEEFFHKDENGNMWACTGDIGYVDEDGELFICGRATDGCTAPDGTTVYFFDVEDWIYRTAEVSACKVVDVNINGKMMLVANIVAGKPDGGSSMLKDDTVFSYLVRRIEQDCRTEIDALPLPLVFRQYGALPVNPSSRKIDTAALRAEKRGFVDMNGNIISRAI